VKITFSINGRDCEVDADGTTTLLTLLRETLGLTGAKPACEVGECGACSVFVDQRLVNACMVLAPQVDGRTVITIEGLPGTEDGPNDVQRAFLDAGAVQCGYCTPGFVMAAEALLASNPAPSRKAIREAIAGNLCRCTGYQQIADAVELASVRRRSGESSREGVGGKESWGR
jgi:aerobic carbon-monoxide dehydrogenase small subunit